MLGGAVLGASAGALVLGGGLLAGALGLGAGAKALELVDGFGDEGVRESHFGGHALVDLPLYAFLNKDERHAAVTNT